MVAMNVWPTDAADGSVASEARWRKMAKTWAPTGTIPGVGGELAVSLVYPNLTVKSGAAWVDGHYCELLGDQVLAVTASGLVVIRFDPAANTAQLLYLDGVTTPTQNPSGTWEFVLALISASSLVRQAVSAAPGAEILFSQMNNNVTITATSIATSQTLINPGNVSYDGTPVWVETYFPGITQPNLANAQMVVNLFDVNTDTGYMGAIYAPVATGMQIPMIGRRRITPSPGLHNYNLRGWINPSGSAIVVGGNVYPPGYLRITRA